MRHFEVSTVEIFLMDYMQRISLVKSKIEKQILVDISGYSGVIWNLFGGGGEALFSHFIYLLTHHPLITPLPTAVIHIENIRSR